MHIAQKPEHGSTLKNGFRMQEYGNGFRRGGNGGTLFRRICFSRSQKAD